MGFLKSVWDAARRRCPRCRKGRIFQGLFKMNDPCPVCGLVFQREEGYFLGSMYISYALSVFLLVPCFVLTYWLLDGWNRNAILLLVLVPYLPMTPLVYSYSRVVWIYIDRWVCPSDISAGPYEKLRQRQAKTPDSPK
jgi:uncharacterized protein (DUF983 family)